MELRYSLYEGSYHTGVACYCWRGRQGCQSNLWRFSWCWHLYFSCQEGNMWWARNSMGKSTYFVYSEDAFCQEQTQSLPAAISFCHRTIWLERVRCHYLLIPLCGKRYSQESKSTSYLLLSLPYPICMGYVSWISGRIWVAERTQKLDSQIFIAPYQKMGSAKQFQSGLFHQQLQQCR